MQLEKLSQEIWERKYKASQDSTIEDTWRRVAKAVASVEKDQKIWEHNFYRILEDFKFIPGGRITNGAGTKNNYLLNCASVPIFDAIAGENSIARTAERVAYMSKCNYGCGINFDPIRPKGFPISVGGFASGVVSFMKVFDTWTSVIQDGGGRRAALIGLLPIHHVDIFDFIDAKREEGVLTNFNISVGITDEFINAVKNDADFNLRWNGTVYKTIKARDLWEKLCYSAWMYNDPGLLMLDQVNKYNNMYYKYELDAVNPCGEITLPSGNNGSTAGGVCDLGNINLTKFIYSSFGEIRDWKLNFDWELYEETIRIAVRFLDNVLDVSDFPYEDLASSARADRRIGLNGVAGLGSFLAMMKVPYDSELAREIASTIQEFCTKIAYYESINLAKERGSFPNFDADKFVKSNFIIEILPEDIRNDIRIDGIRNCALLTIPPVGTGSLIAGNISNGIEPIFSCEYNRNIRQMDNTIKTEAVEDYAWRKWKSFNMMGSEAALECRPDYFKTAIEIDPIDHIKMQAALQKYIDNSISKTVNLPSDYTLEDYKKTLMFAIDSGLKGYTSYRSGTRDAVLIEKKDIKQKIKEKTSIKLELQERPRELDGKTYKIKDQHGKVYVTVNHIDNNGTKKPWEIFMYSSNENQEMYAALGKTLSAIMRRNDDISFIIDDLKSIKSSTEDGGYFTQEYGFIRSKPQHIGLILEEYVNKVCDNQSSNKIEFSKCPECNELQLVREGGCEHCLACNYSKCG